MTPTQAERVRIRKRWKARLYALAFAALRGRVEIAPKLLEEARAHAQDERRRPVILVAHHTVKTYLLFRVLDCWPGRALVFANDASSRYLRLLKAVGMVPGRLEVRHELALRDLQAMVRGEAVLFALADVNVGATGLFHHSVDGRLRIFSAGWAELAHRLSARVICLRADVVGRSGTIAFEETGLGRTAYDTAARALDWFFDTQERARAWDFHAAGVLEPPLALVGGPDDVRTLYKTYAASAMHYIGQQTNA